jgi:hypothetical protein
MSYGEPGLETLYRAEKSNLKTETDVLVLCGHWALTNRGYRCVGSGDSDTW